MLKPIKTILFATDLSANCQPALDFTISVATRFNAKICMLYVIEKLSEHVDERLREMVGVHQWEELVNVQMKQAHKSLLGKTPENVQVRQAIHNFCLQEGIAEEGCDVKDREIIITHGDIVEDIVATAVEKQCDLIVLGGHDSLIGRSSVGSKIKGVIKRTNLPVTVVPADAS
ncbi:universal stress protein [Desulforhopalus singaporensis]|uniref:Nucleotide-binding universal stress protein, UspA family n=1 Tax=Desulforhopalus singaporensis TaxID=91360 RepID=A0A1H0TCY5_9BACT|nr:universal stress protein [Desulforhopalus singaporensis]SDP51913.1 Nucleotide-binding universal stress protein, UspA family [Desulforhopalus singaporensis]